MGLIYLLFFIFDLFLNWRFLLGLVVAVGLAYLVNQYIPNYTIVRAVNGVILVVFVGGSLFWQIKHRRKYEMKIQEKITKWMKENLNF